MAQQTKWRKKLKDSASWSPVTSDTLSLPPNVLGEYFSRFTATTRPLKEGRLRLGSEILCSFTDAGASFKICTVRGEIQASLPMELYREVAAELLIKYSTDSTPEAVHVLGAMCLLPEGDQCPLKEDGGPAKGPRGGKIDYKECRGGEYCLHVVTFLSRVHLASLKGSTETACSWTAPTQVTKADLGCEPLLDAILTLAPNEKLMARAAFNPVDEADIRALQCGIRGDTAYSRAYSAYREAKLQCIARQNPKLTGRPLCLDIITEDNSLQDPGVIRPGDDSGSLRFSTQQPCPPATKTLNDAQGEATAAPAAAAAAAAAAAGKEENNERPRKNPPLTRARAEALRRKHAHVCICPLRGECPGESFVRLPPVIDPRRKAWLSALCVEDAEWKDARVSLCHWPEKAVQRVNLSSKLVSGAPPPRKQAKFHDSSKLEESMANAEAAREKCICTLAEDVCGYDAVQEEGNRLVFRKGSSHMRKWLKILRPAASSRELNDLLQRPHVVVARHHFAPHHILTSASGKRKFATEAAPTFQPYCAKTPPARPNPLTPEEIEVRQRLKETDLLHSPEARSVVRALIVEREEAKHSLEALAVPMEEDEKPSPDADAALKRREFIERLKDPRVCRSFTGEPSFDVLTLLFEYLNARGVLDNLTWWRTVSETPREAPKRGGGVRELSSFESLVLFLCMLHNNDSTVSYQLHFAVSETTVYRTYITMLKALDVIFQAHQPWPTLEQARRATPTNARTMLRLSDDTALFMGDATERAIENPALPALHCLVYSDYKHRTTMKHNAVAAGNGYICEISTGYPGSTSDNALHEREEVGKRIAGDGSLPTAYVYDKGLTQYHHVEKHGPTVLTPPVKEQGQFNFSEDSEWTRKIAKIRCPIEKLFRYCRTYKAFDREIHLASVDLANVEARVVRGLVNMWPHMDDLDLTGDAEETL